MKPFKAKIEIIGINPYIEPPQNALNEVFKQAGRDKGSIPVKGKLNGEDFIQTLVKYAGKWRLYLNTPMREATNTQVGDNVTVTFKFDNKPREVEMPKELKKALSQHKEAKKIFDELPQSRQKEINRYIAGLKSAEAIEKNVQRVINFLLGKERFIGRDKP